MTYRVYSVYDVKSCTYAPPFVSVNDSVAQRSFDQLAMDPRSTVNFAPDDYRLMCLGQFDDEAGSLFGFGSPEFISVPSLVHSKKE